MIAYKGAHHYTCKEITYEVGKTYTFHGQLELCVRGFHFCKEIDDLDNFYRFDGKNINVFEIEVLGDVIDHKDSKHPKSVTNKFKIIREIPRKEWLTMLKHHFFDDQGRLIKKTYKSGDWIKFKYDANGKWLGFTKSSGDFEKLKYNKQGEWVKKETVRCVSKKDENGYNVVDEEAYKDHSPDKILWQKRTYNKKNQCVKEERSDGSWSTIEYDARGNVVKEEYSNGVSKVNAYDEKSNALIRTDTYEKGKKTDWVAFDIDSKGRRIRVERPNGVEITEYDENDNIAKYHTPNLLIKYTYDKDGRIIREDYGDDGKNWEKKHYNKNGFLVKEEKSDGSWAKMKVDAVGRCLSEELNTGEFKKHKYNEQGSLVAYETNGMKWRISIK